MNMKNRFLYVEPYVYITVKSGQGLVLNTFNNKVYITSNEQVVQILSNLLASDRGNLIPLNTDYIGIDEFIAWLRKSFSGDIFSTSSTDTLPIQILPNFSDFSFNEISKNKIYDITFYINTQCPSNCYLCGSLSKQMIYCRKKHHTETLSVNTIFFFIRKIGIDRIRSISFTGGNIMHKDLYKYLELVKGICCEKHLYIHITQLSVDNIDMLSGCDFNISILLPPQYELHRLTDLIKIMQLLNLKYDICQPILSEETLTSNKGIDINYVPYYDQNSIFFQKYVFLNQEDLISKKTTMQELINNNNFNSYFLGKLIVDSNSDVYISLADKVIGNIATETSINNLIESLYANDSLWRLSRKSTSPCNTCIFNLICPPISNYELQIKRNNLCTIKD